MPFCVSSSASTLLRHVLPSLWNCDAGSHAIPPLLMSQLNQMKNARPTHVLLGHRTPVATVILRSRLSPMTKIALRHGELQNPGIEAFAEQDIVRDAVNLLRTRRAKTVLAGFV